MIEFLAVVNRGLSVVASLLPAVVWCWMAARGYSRGQTFFGAQVQLGFIDSITGHAILKEFRWRLWSWSVVGAAAAVLAPVDLAAFIGGLISTLAGSVAFVLANRRTQHEAQATANTTVRVASLVAENEPEGLWVGVLDWLAMLVPPAVPAATLMVLALHWSYMPAEFHRAAGVFPIFFGLIMGLMCTANQWALRFRARSSDWASTPGASHKYRAYLGASLALVFAFITCQICVLALMQLKNAIPFMRHVDMPTYFLVSLPAQGVWMVCVWKMRFWLTRHLATDSRDPMPDTCWKWGCIYFNPGDPALVVPSRTGTGQSFNFARPSVWVVGGTVALATIVSLGQSVLWRIGHHFPN